MPTGTDTRNMSRETKKDRLKTSTGAAPVAVSFKKKDKTTVTGSAVQHIPRKGRSSHYKVITENGKTVKKKVNDLQFLTRQEASGPAIASNDVIRQRVQDRVLALNDASGRTPATGLELIEDVKEIKRRLQDNYQNGMTFLYECRNGKDYPSPNVFDVLSPENIISLLLDDEQNLYEGILESAGKFEVAMNKNLDYVQDNELNELGGNSTHPMSIKPAFIMDHTIREPATDTKFGHTAEMKYAVHKLIRAFGSTNIALSGMYYGNNYTVEEQFLELLYSKEGRDGMKGGFVMSGIAEEDRQQCLAAVGKFEVPNVFYDLTLVPNVRFKPRTIAEMTQQALDAIKQSDEVLSSKNYPEATYVDTQNERFPTGQIYLNLVDIMEAIGVKPGEDVQGNFLKPKRQEIERMFKTLKNDKFFQKRVRGMLFEEARGMYMHDDYGSIAQWLRNFFPEKDFKILIHAHEGSGFANSCSSSAVANGADGVWSSFIPQAAQAGHNWFFLYLHQMLLLGNKSALSCYKINQGRALARMLHTLNDSTFVYPSDCPLFGTKSTAQVHAAFKTQADQRNVGGGNTGHNGGDGGLRMLPKDIYDRWSPESTPFLDDLAQTMNGLKALEVKMNRGAEDRAYRIAPLVSDSTDTIGNAMAQYGFVVDDDKNGIFDQNEIADAGMYGQKCMMACMNAGIRTDFGSRRFLEMVHRHRLVVIHQLIEQKARMDAQILQNPDALWKQLSVRFSNTPKRAE